MKSKTRNIVIASTCGLIVLFALALFLHLRDAVAETKQATKDEIHNTGEHLREKVDKASDRVAEDYGTAKEKTKAAAAAAKTKYEEWKQKRQANKEEQTSPAAPETGG